MSANTQPIEITFPIPGPWWLSSNQRIHYRKEAELTRYLRQSAAARARNAGLPRGIETPVNVVAYITYPRASKADPNNAAPTTKALIDGLTDHGVWPDDDSKHVLGPDHRHGGVTPGQRTVRFVITRAEEREDGE